MTADKSVAENLRLGEMGSRDYPVLNFKAIRHCHCSVKEEPLSVAKGETHSESASKSLIQKKGLDQSSGTNAQRNKKEKQENSRILEFLFPLDTRFHFVTTLGQEFCKVRGTWRE